MSAFATANIDEVVEQLTTNEAILLTAGVGSWYTCNVDRLSVPDIKVSDGPNGVRGEKFVMGTPAKCLPCGSALGATWDTRLIEEVVGFELLSKEAKLRLASLLLAPTVNIPRNPLGGRSFECFSEDPFLSGKIATSYIKGVQKGGISTAIKHFVTNDKEDDRHGYNAILSPRALREIYLMPFMLAQKYAKPWTFLTAYNRFNGLHACENPFLLKTILRDEWKFDGLVMSDWLGTYGVDLALNAGVDLEMPGDKKWRTLDYVSRAIQARKLTDTTLKQRARNVLGLVKKCAQNSPEIMDDDHGQETSYDSEGDKLLMRKLASETIVLLRNEGNVLPLDPQKLKKVAIIGPNAKAKVLSGGGSAALNPSYYISTYDGIVSALHEAGSGTTVTYSEGTMAYKTLPPLDYDMYNETGSRGWVLTWHKHEDDDSFTPLDDPLETQLVNHSRLVIGTLVPKGLTRIWTIKLRGYLKPRDHDCMFEFGLIAAGRAKLFVDGHLVIDNWTRQRRGEDFLGKGSQEERGRYSLKATKLHEIFVVFSNVSAPADGDEDENVIDSSAGLHLGGAEVQDSDALIQQAVDLAKNADVVIAVVGLNADWEAEGYDRTTLVLPGRTDELVKKVAAVNAKTVVVTQSGSAITMPWVHLVPSIVHAWYLGNECGNAIADVLFGKQNPGGKLSLTFPKAEKDLPSYGYFHSENGVIRYAEDLWVGYKYYQHRKIDPLFAFGHGLSYTKFTLMHLRLSEALVLNGEFRLEVSLVVENVGHVTGSEVVQVYSSLSASSDLTHPLLQLRGFAKVHDLAPRKTKHVHIVLDKYAVSYWNDLRNAWAVEEGVYTLAIGTSSDHLPLKAKFEIKEAFDWNGL
jgi:beta-glucosidase